MGPTYRCLCCGGEHGEAEGNGSENWFWLLVPHGRIGPFCSKQHAKDWEEHQKSGRFSLKEWEHLCFQRATNPEALEHRAQLQA